MRKKVAVSSLIILLGLMALMPAVNATVQRYLWDNVYFIEGVDEAHDIKYPHPDRGYYEISAFSNWQREGDYLQHFQINHAQSQIIKGSVVAIGAFMGTIVGARLVGTVGAVVGFATGLVLGLALTWVIDVYFVDECNCIWWWLNTDFMYWVIANQWDLYYLCITNPTQAQNVILGAFLSCGYLRAGSVTFYDSVGVGNPQPYYTLTVSASSGGTTHNPEPGIYTYDYGTVLVVSASRTNTKYTFDYWLLDGTMVYSNPIVVTMNSDHTLEAHFYYSGGGSGGGGGWYYR